jgi:hypothetical protein
MIVFDQEMPVRDARKAAIIVAETIDVPKGERWRLAKTDGRITTIRDVPLAAVWVARAATVVMRIFGREVAMIRWDTLPQRVLVDTVVRTDEQRLVDGIADLLWMNRHAIVLDEPGWSMNPAQGAARLRLPGDVEITIRTRLTSIRDVGVARRTYDVHTAGILRTFKDDEAAPLEAVWQNIVCQRFLDALEPGRTTLERRSDSESEALLALCRLLEREEAPPQRGSYRGRASRYEYETRMLPSIWRQLPGTALFCDTKESVWDKRIMLISDGEYGIVSVDRQRVLDAENRRATKVVENAIACTPSIIAGPSKTGSPKAAMLVRLLRDALARWPDLADADGTAIAPLLNLHLPRLLDGYAAAKATDTDEEVAATEARFDSGLESIGRALEEALTLRRDSKRDDLRVEVAFLMARHPERTTLGPVLED